MKVGEGLTCTLDGGGRDVRNALVGSHTVPVAAEKILGCVVDDGRRHRAPPTPEVMDQGS